jgi:hypothetical protein
MLSNKKEDKMKKRLLIRILTIFFLFLLGVSSANGTLMVLPQGSTVEGQTIDEWTAQWWQWAFSQSVPNDAFTDSTGATASVNQSGPVFFIAGTTGGTATRSFTIPADLYLLVPLINSSVSESYLGVSATEAELRNIADASISAVDSLFAEIDGMPVPNLFDYRELSPLFSFNAATDNPFSVPPGPSGNAVSDGYWLMLEPLGIGTHTINFGGGISDIFTVDVMDTITVVPEPSTILLLGSGLAGLAAFRRKFKKK